MKPLSCEITGYHNQGCLWIAKNDIVDIGRHVIFSLIALFACVKT